MKLAFGLHNKISYFGGWEKLVLRIAEFLLTKGYDIEIRSLPLNQDHYGGNGELSGYLRGIPYFESLSHKVDADVTYITYHPLASLTFRTDSPIIAGIHSQVFFLPPNPRYGFIPTLASLVHRILGKTELSRFDAVHINNPFLTQFIIHNRTYCISNFVDTERYYPRWEKSDEFTVLFVGRPCWQKGWDIFLTLAPILAKDNIKIVCAGSSDSTFVKGYGYVKDDSQLSEIYSSAHVTVYPSRADVFGSVIIESLACGTPVITSPLPTHQALQLPLYYAEGVQQILRAVQYFKLLWLSRREDYNARCLEVRRSVEKYDIGNVGPWFERMLVEVSQLA